jgi:uncharacterized protein
VGLKFEWDERRARANEKKHGVAFEEAATAFGDPLSITIHDPEHSGSHEERYALLGLSHRNRLLVVVHVERGDNIRIISARPATRRERKDHEEG